MTTTGIDLRGFDYQLAPLQQRAYWILDDLQARAARALAGVQALKTQLRQVEDGCEEQRRHLAGNAQRYLDPAMHRRALDYFLRTSASMAALREQIDAAHCTHRELVEQCLQQQLRIDMFESHRLRQMEEYAMAQCTRTAAEQDQAWTARSRWLEVAGEEDAR
ncbi:hypothetical protein G5S34_20120 [Herbaspirillum frisingense]|uniref:hypothetical protein n=1 Tax=Herbaspirillum frisingense TaxID=92645 RepID=UPI0015FECCF8|nr:hypothetical protein [Herbaspirillum frisingense]QNB08833.1 hypothetical protein G5S34_20120 [Herbaspirillum frisingense]